MSYGAKLYIFKNEQWNANFSLKYLSFDYRSAVPINRVIQIVILETGGTFTNNFVVSLSACRIEFFHSFVIVKHIQQSILTTQTAYHP